MNIHFSTCAFDIRNRSSLPRKITRYLTKTDTANGGMRAAFSRMFNDTLTLGISFKVPVWIQKVLGLDVSAQGFGAGFAYLTNLRHN
jgi:hypothetical protein